MPLRSHVSGWNRVFIFLILVGLVTGAGVAGTLVTAGVGCVGGVLGLVGLGLVGLYTLGTGLGGKPVSGAGDG